MQNITDSEFQREVEALKSHRRISVNRPLLDPDLPDLAAAHGGGREILGSPTDAAGARVGVDLTDEGPLKGAAGSPTSGARQAFTARRRGAAAEAEATAAEGEAASPSRSSRKAAAAGAGSEVDEDTPLGPTDPSHLFWVPASMHPEISPSDFRKFLQEHASRAVREHTPPDSPPSGTAGAYPPAGSGASAGQAGFAFASRSSSNSGATTPPPSPVDIVSRSTSIARRGSTLRRQYRPENDTGDSSDDAGAHLGRSGSRRAGPPTLSIDDLQRLEKLAEEASHSQDPAQLRSVLRRTMSLGVNNSALDQVDALPAESEDAPLIVPRPGQILRRAARTKIRKSSFSGDNGRTGRRRGTPSGSGEDGTAASSTSTSLTDMASVARAVMERRQSDMSEMSSGDDGDAGSPRPLSDEATESIVDAYSRDSYLSEEGSQRTSVTSLADSLHGSSGGSADVTVGGMTVSGELPTSRSPSPPVTPTQSTLAPPAKGYFDIQRAQAQPDSSDTQLAEERCTSEEQQTSWNLRPVPVSHVPPMPGFEKTARRAPQPPSSAATTPQATSSRVPAVSSQPAQYQAPPQSAPAQTISMTQQQQQAQQQQQRVPSSAPSNTPSPPLVQQQQQQPQRPGKEKKSSFASWFGIGKDEESEAEQRASKARKKEKERKEREQAELERHEKEKERDSSSFLGALFGKKKGGDDAHANAHMVRTPDGHITAGSLLDRGMQGGRAQYVNYYRYPIHIERAVYRLSHIKLANPRRPLYEQVLISNLMFWYLSIINRSQQQQQQQLQAQAQAAQGAAPVAQPQPGQPMQPVAESAAAERQPGSPDPAQAEEPSSPELVPDHAESRASAPQPKAKRTGLVKPNRAPPGSRSAETAIPAAAYGAQHRQINSDLAREQREAAAAALGGAGPVIAVGQVVDPRVIGAHAGYVQQQVSNGQQQQQREQGRLPPGAAPPAGRASTSPTLAAQRMRGNSTPQESRASSSGAWLGSGGAAPSAAASTGQRRPTGVASASLAGDEHKWLGSGGSGGGGSTSRSHSKSPQPERSSEPMSAAWRVENEGWDEASAAAGGRKGVRGSEPVEAYYPAENGDAAPLHARSDSDGAIRGRSPYGDSRDSSASTRSGSRPHTAGSDSSSTTYASARAISPEPAPSAVRPRTKSSTNAAAAPQVAAGGAGGPVATIPLNAGSAAMIEAARSSQSRRR